MTTENTTDRRTATMNVNDLANRLADTDEGSAVLALHENAPMRDRLAAEQEDLRAGIRLGIVDEEGAATAGPALPADLPVPVIIDHRTFMGHRQLKRVDEVELGVEGHPDVLKTLGLDDPDRPLAQLRGDTVDIDNRPVGAVRGWRTYVYADEPLTVVREL